MQTDKNRNRILVAVDGSEQSMNAVHYTSRVFPPEKTEIVLFNVNPEMPDLYRDMESNALYCARMPQIRSWRAEQQKSISEFMNAAFKVFLDNGFPVDAVTMKAEAKKVGITRDILKESHKGYNAVIVGRTGVSTIKDLVIGSVATKLVGKIKHIPLIVVGNVTPARRVMIAFDGSEGAMRSVAYVGCLLGGTDCHIMLTHVLRSLGTLKLEATRLFPPDKELEWLEENRNCIETAIEKAKHILNKADLSSELIQNQILMNKMSRAGSLVEAAKAGAYSTIVVGRRRSISFREEFFLGRVSLKVLQLASSLAVWFVS